MRTWYEQVWAELPDELEAPYVGLRADFLRRHVRRGDRVLDLGCGDGPFVEPLIEAGAQVTAADVAEQALERARRRAPEGWYVRVEPHGPFPFDDGAFDLVWASEVIEHVADTERWIDEVRRVLRRGGLLLLTTPAIGPLRRLVEAPDPRGQHLRFYTRRSLRALLREMGFEMVELRARRGLLLAAAMR